VPMMISWSISNLDNIEPTTATSAFAFLPAAPARSASARPSYRGAPGSRTCPAATAATCRSARGSAIRAAAGPVRLRAALPARLTFSVLQGFHGPFSHKGSNEFAVDFGLPGRDATCSPRVRDHRRANASAQGLGARRPTILDYRNHELRDRDARGRHPRRVHAPAPSSGRVKPGQKVDRREMLALSGKHRFSSTPHLHFQVMPPPRTGSARGRSRSSSPRGSHKVEEPRAGRATPAGIARRRGRRAIIHVMGLGLASWGACCWLRPRPSLPARQPRHPTIATGARTFVAFAGRRRRRAHRVGTIPGAVRYRGAVVRYTHPIDILLAAPVLRAHRDAPRQHHVSIFAVESAASRASPPSSRSRCWRSGDARAATRPRSGRSRVRGRRAVRVPGLRCRIGSGSPPPR